MHNNECAEDPVKPSDEDIPGSLQSNYARIVDNARNSLRNVRNTIKNGLGQVKNSGNVGKAKGKLTIDGNECIFDENAYSGYNNVQYADRDAGVLLRENGKCQLDPNPKKVNPNFDSYPEEPYYADDVIKVPSENGKADAFPRHNCAECKLIENIRAKIGSGKTVEGSFELSTEKTPCDSCKGIIAKFSSQFPNVEIRVVDCDGNIFIVKNGDVSCTYGNSSW